MDFINLKTLNLTAEESEDLIKLLAQKRGITTKKLLSTIKLNLERKNNKDLASKSQQKLIKSIKSQQKLAKTQLELIKSQQKLIKSIKKQKSTKQTKSQRELIKSQRKLKIRNSFYNIDKKINKKVSNTNVNKKINNTNVDKKIDNTNTNVDKKINNTNDEDFIENIRDLFNNKLDKKVYNTNVDKKINNTNDEDFIESIKDLFNNKLDKKINNNTNDDFIENIRDLFSILDYEPVLIKSGFDNNYLGYMSNGNNSLRFNEYLELIKPYLYDLINVYKAKGEWKLQLSAEISFVSQKPGSNENRVMYTRSTPEEFMTGSEREEVAENLIMSILQKYQDNLQNKMKGSDFIFNGINYL